MRWLTQAPQARGWGLRSRVVDPDVLRENRCRLCRTKSQELPNPDSAPSTAANAVLPHHGIVGTLASSPKARTGVGSFL
jgi:hypothetical protein